MGFFSNSYDKPGPGVDPDAPQKRSFFRFFELLRRKFGKLCQANLIYSLTLIPTFIVVFWASAVVIENIAVSLGIFSDEISDLIWLGSLILSNLLIALWGAGPATAGISYIMRNFAREEHAWVWSDFMDEIKSNFKQSIIVFAIDIAVLIIFCVAIVYYVNMGGLMAMLRYVIYIAILVYTMMHFYIYPLMITFKLPLKAIYKNAFLFALAKSPSNILVLIVHSLLHVGAPICAIMYGGKYSFIILIGVLLLELIISQAFSAFLTAFNAYPKMKKYMLDVAEEAEVKASRDEE